MTSFYIFAVGFGLVAATSGTTTGATGFGELLTLKDFANIKPTPTVIFVAKFNHVEVSCGKPLSSTVIATSCIMEPNIVKLPKTVVNHDAPTFTSLFFKP